MKSNVFKLVLIAAALGTGLVLIHALFITRFDFHGLAWPILVANFMWGVALTVIVAVGFARARRRSLEALTEQKRELELAGLSLKNEIAHHHQTQEQLGQAHKLEAIGRLAGGVAHDINNVLASVMSVASAVKLDIQSGQRDHSTMEDMDDILEACKRGRDLTHSLLGFARKGDFSKRAMSMAAAVLDVKKLLDRVAPKTIDIQLHISPDAAQIEGDPSQIKNILMNLCINGIDAMKNSGTLALSLENEQIATSVHGLTPGNYLVLRVSDTGEGMSEEIIARAFDPFYTTKPEGMGTGLGLSRVWGAVQEHGGTVTVSSRPGHGAVFTVYIPALGIIEQDPGIRRSFAPTVDNRQTSVLLVDDEELIRKTTRRLLEKLGYRVHAAANGLEAVEYFSTQASQIDLVLLDMMMPVMGGAVAFRRLREIDPLVPIVLCSGYSKDSSAAELLREPFVGFVQKPFSPGDLTEQLQTLLRESAPRIAVGG